MKYSLLLLALLVNALAAQSQAQKDTSFNFDFEKTANGFAARWENFGSDAYAISLDSLNAKSGRYAGSIRYSGDSADYRALSFTLPNNYAGKRITLTGYVKTENVTDGYAGLWMRIDPSIAFDNMNANGIKGTTDWKQCSITLDMQPERTSQIVIGGLLVGKGRMWIDDLHVTVDGKDVRNLAAYQRKIYPAELDKAFDKGSGIATVPTDAATLENLRVLGMVWGFVKYYHPAVGKGAYNWDYELFRILPKVIAAKSTAERDAELVKWLGGLGSFEQGKTTEEKPDRVKLQPDLEWLANSGFSTELTALLSRIRSAKRNGEHYYVGLVPGVDNPQFKNEKAYAGMAYPDAGYRLLSLFRYWNIIQYYFPNRHLIGEDWKGVLTEFLPRFITAENQTAYTLAALELIGRIHDTHANLWGSNSALQVYWGRRYAAPEITFAEGKAVVRGYYNDSLGKASGLLPGDVIATVNGRPVDDIVKERLVRTPASNFPTQLRDIAPNLLRSNDSALRVEYVRDGKTASATVPTYPSARINIYKRFYQSDTCFKLLDGNIGYISNGTVKAKYLPALWKVIEKTKGLVIDNRNYPSEFVLYQLGEYLMPGSIPFVKFSKGSLATPGLFTLTPTMSAGTRGRTGYKGKVVILVNETSQSSSEFHAMAYRAFPGAVVVGSITAGADGNVSQFALPGGLTTMISGIGVYYPDGRETQRVGIVPDVEVKPTVAGIKSGRDEVLEKAISIINQQ